MVDKITSPITPLGEIDKINEIIDELDNIDQLPSQTGQSGKYLTTNGTVPSWADVQNLPSQTGKAGKFLQTDGTDASWESAPFRNIGEIVASTIPLTDAGLHLLDGSLIQGSGIYSAFVAYIASLDLTASYFCTEAEWQASISQYGVCGKFVYDSVNNTVRLPKITGIVEGTTDLTALGSLVQAGLPNITGVFSPSTDLTTAWSDNKNTGAFGITRTSSANAIRFGNLPGGTGLDTDFDASRSSSIYGKSKTVQPQTIKAFYYIVIATSTKTDIQVDIDEIATDLNGKADVDLSNCTKPHIVETYVNCTSWYRVYSDGWCEQGGMSSGGEVTITLLKPYRDTMYLIMDALYSTGSGLNVQGTQSIQNYSKTTNGFHLGQGISSANVSGHYWYTEGYIR